MVEVYKRQVDVSDKNGIPHPNIITESGRALTDVYKRQCGRGGKLYYQFIGHVDKEPYHDSVSYTHLVYNCCPWES